MKLDIFIIYLINPLPDGTVNKKPIIGIDNFYRDSEYKNMLFNNHLKSSLMFFMQLKYRVQTIKETLIWYKYYLQCVNAS